MLMRRELGRNQPVVLNTFLSIPRRLDAATSRQDRKVSTLSFRFVSLVRLQISFFPCLVRYWVGRRPSQVMRCRDCLQNATTHLPSPYGTPAGTAPKIGLGIADYVPGDAPSGGTPPAIDPVRVKLVNIKPPGPSARSRQRKRAALWILMSAATPRQNPWQNGVSNNYGTSIPCLPGAGKYIKNLSRKVEDHMVHCDDSKPGGELVQLRFKKK
ncbi:hypothetical protein IF1G_09120 [Cordyceps javanica]|uniref:Uncharacterized protein n=1 Tax=Cordyceps javanica TaxID=43265 RepID=A0A545VR00_9HYPO|nr:hypothetical protein IF1G_09120 [Cordyceps javanica]TQW04163.1 hypothetical protein IF2G_08477 [Cordyceps javanica]